MVPIAVELNADTNGFTPHMSLFHSHISERFFDETDFRGNQHSVRQSRFYSAWSFVFVFHYLFVVDSCSRCLICIAPLFETMSSRQSSLRSDPSYDASDDYEPVDVGF